jgi:hypothetical protein
VIDVDNKVKNNFCLLFLTRTMWHEEIVSRGVQHKGVSLEKFGINEYNCAELH